MDAERVTLIRRKNVAYYLLVKGEVACLKRRKRGPVPADWLARLAELEAEYRAAVQALRVVARGGRGV